MVTVEEKEGEREKCEVEANDVEEEVEEEEEEEERSETASPHEYECRVNPRRVRDILEEESRIEE